MSQHAPPEFKAVEPNLAAVKHVTQITFPRVHMTSQWSQCFSSSCVLL